MTSDSETQKITSLFNRKHLQLLTELVTIGRLAANKRLNDEQNRS